MLSWWLRHFYYYGNVSASDGRWGDNSGVNKLYKVGLIVFTLSSLDRHLSLQHMVYCYTVSAGHRCRFHQYYRANHFGLFFPAQHRDVSSASRFRRFYGLSLGPFFCGMLTQQIGWQSIFIASTILGFISISIAFRFWEKMMFNLKNRKIRLYKG